MEVLLLVAACFWLAWVNGANDNFIGTATLYGSRTASYRTALIWATIATGAGCAVSLGFAHLLVERFSGAGLLGADSGSLRLFASVAAGAALTKIVATRLGMPVSTTHALIGGLVGAGLVANAASVNWQAFATLFAAPLVASPLLAITLTALAYTVLHRVRTWSSVHEQTCLCIGRCAPQPVTVLTDGRLMLREGAGPPLVVEDWADCVSRYEGRVMGMRAQQAVDIMHYGSAASVCFARAVSDTPKIAALMLAAAAFQAPAGTYGVLALVSFAMLLGGWMFARRVAETMSRNIADINCGQGLTANLVTAFLVLFASRLGLPVSTTQVACSAIFGIGAVKGEYRWGMVSAIALAWLATAPLALTLGAGVYWALGLWYG